MNSHRLKLNRGLAEPAVKGLLITPDEAREESKRVQLVL